MPGFDVRDYSLSFTHRFSLHFIVSRSGRGDLYPDTLHVCHYWPGLNYVLLFHSQCWHGTKSNGKMFNHCQVLQKESRMYLCFICIANGEQPCVNLFLLIPHPALNGTDHLDSINQLIIHGNGSLFGMVRKSDSYGEFVSNEYTCYNSTSKPGNEFL